MIPFVSKAADYLMALRKERMTREYELGDRDACFGLLPESTSHEVPRAPGPFVLG